jgi:ribulose-5-phosphate 4-epimerase/fuculose-1-phosphate aldolase
VSAAEWKARVQLAAAYRVAAHLKWDAVIYNHITLRVPGADEHFLINAFGMHFSEITASSLVKIDNHGTVIHPGCTDLGYNQAGFVIHSALHETKRDDMQVVWHTHHTAASAVASLKSGLLPLSLEAVNIWPKISPTSHVFEGVSNDEGEKARLRASLGGAATILIMQNHGVCVGRRRQWECSAGAECAGPSGGRSHSRAREQRVITCRHPGPGAGAWRPG